MRKWYICLAWLQGIMITYGGTTLENKTTHSLFVNGGLLWALGVTGYFLWRWSIEEEQKRDERLSELLWKMCEEDQKMEKLFDRTSYTLNQLVDKIGQSTSNQNN